VVSINHQNAAAAKACAGAREAAHRFKNRLQHRSRENCAEGDTSSLKSINAFRLQILAALLPANTPQVLVASKSAPSPAQKVEDKYDQRDHQQ
jgi:hypothetical protein